jgi:hypothetical protein
MPILPTGSFSFTIQADELARGLRPTRRAPRNSKYLIKCIGAIGIDGVLQVIDELDRIDTSVITDGFPYPQIFIFTDIVVVCGSDAIYELEGGTLVPKLVSLTAGLTWSAAGFNDFVYMSNGTISIIRRAEDKEWEVVTNLPISSAICNFNGQVIIGSPGVVQP